MMEQHDKSYTERKYPYQAWSGQQIAKCALSPRKQVWEGLMGPGGERTERWSHSGVKGLCSEATHLRVRSSFAPSQLGDLRK